MPPGPSIHYPKNSRTLTRRQALPLVVAGLLLLALLVWQATDLTPPEEDARKGRSVESYGFDLSTCLVSRELIRGTELPKGGQAALDGPATLAGREVSPRVKLAGIHKLVSADRVIGVEIGGEARAYPLWVLEAHEVCNDALGGKEIAVTYNPLCDSAVVFDRTIDGETLSFGASGLVYNSNLLMYDRREGEQRESLWSQLLFRAIAGPAAARGETLAIVPARVMQWDRWFARFPDTTVALPKAARRRVYRPNAFLSYFADEKLRYPVAPLPPAGTWPPKTPIVALRDGDSWLVTPAEMFGAGDAAAGQELVFACWFAWYAMHPNTDTTPPPSHGRP